MVNSYILYNKSTTKDIKWIWNIGYTDSMLLYNILVHKKCVFNFFKLVGMVTLSYSLTYISPSPLKYFFFISNHRTRVSDISKDAEFQAEQKCHL